MKKLSKVDIKKEKFVSKFFGNTLVLRKAIDSLSVGEGLKVMRNEWTAKTLFFGFASGYQQNLKKRGDKRKFSCRTLEGKTGWVVIRLK